MQLRLDTLTRPLFLISLVILLLNDFYLKYEFSNFLTGKLSDIAGLFLFPYFISSFCIKWAKQIYFGTAILFIFWKSAFSQSVIDFVQEIGIGLNRVVDYTDLFTLAILPFSFKYFNRELSIFRNTKKYLTVPIGAICLFAIWATKQPREEVELNLDVNTEYKLEMKKSDFFNEIQARYRFAEYKHNNFEDSIFYLNFDIADCGFADITARSTISELDSNQTKIKLDKILYANVHGRFFTGVSQQDIKCIKSVSKEQFDTYFNENFIELVKNGKGQRVYYDNQTAYDHYRNP